MPAPPRRPHLLPPTFPAHLVISAGDVSMRPFDDRLLAELGYMLRRRHIFPDPSVSWAFDWAVDVLRRPREAIAASMRFQRALRADYDNTHLNLPLAVIIGGQLAGSQDIRALNFPTRGLVTSGSYLFAPFQSKGYGVMMRKMMLEFAFDYLGARGAYSLAHPENVASLGVSTACGYHRAADNRIGPARGEHHPEGYTLMAITPPEFRRLPTPIRVHGVHLEPLENMPGRSRPIRGK